MNVWNRVKRHEVHEDTLQTEDETVPTTRLFLGQEIRINLSAEYRSVTAVTCTSNKGQSTTKDYNVILQFLQMAGLLKTIFSLVGFKVSRCFPRQHVVIKGPNICVLRLIYLFVKLKQ